MESNKLVLDSGYKCDFTWMRKNDAFFCYFSLSPFFFFFSVCSTRWMQPICCNMSQVGVVWHLFEPCLLLPPPGNPWQPFISDRRKHWSPAQQWRDQQPVGSISVPKSLIVFDKMYLSQLLILFVKIVKCICPNCKPFIKQTLKTTTTKGRPQHHHSGAVFRSKSSSQADWERCKKIARRLFY